MVADAHPSQSNNNIITRRRLMDGAEVELSFK